MHSIERFLPLPYSRPLVNKPDAFLYQHSTHCAVALQRFLDRNPDYWCLVPMLWDEARIEDNTASSITIAPRTTTVFAEIQQSPTLPVQANLFAFVIDNMTRSKQEAHQLAKNLPKPPNGYRFSHRQQEQQVEFFKNKKDMYVVPNDFADLFNYAIVAVCE